MTCLALYLALEVVQEDGVLGIQHPSTNARVAWVGVNWKGACRHTHNTYFMGHDC